MRPNRVSANFRKDWNYAQCPRDDRPNGTAWSVMPGPTASDPNTAVTGLSALPSGEAWATGATFSVAAATAFIAHHTP